MKIVVGAILVSISILLIFLHANDSYDDFYWSSSIYYITISAISTPFAIIGSCLFGLSIRPIINRAGRFISWIAGIIVTLLGILLILLSLGLWIWAIIVALDLYYETCRSGYFSCGSGIPFNSCDFQGILKFLSVLSGLLGGFFIGLVLPRGLKRAPRKQKL